ncbi:MAG: hypothetical protein ACJ72W_01575 [Actinoallomurus sp.]
MRIANLCGRLAILEGGLAIDVEIASGGRFGSDPQAIYQRWAEFTEWAGRAALPVGQSYDKPTLGSPAPAPRQVFAIGLNFDEHAAESGYTTPNTEPAPHAGAAAGARRLRCGISGRPGPGG